jgi:hypothetical protein
MATKTTKAQTYIVDVEHGPKIQMLLAKTRMNGNCKYSSISDFVNIAIREKLTKEGTK